MVIFSYWNALIFILLKTFLFLILHKCYYKNNKVCVKKLTMIK